MKPKRRQKKNKRKRKKVDRLSNLPDSIISHILSFLPTTRDAIRTGVLSKRWKNQWRQVPVLIFHHEYPNDVVKVLNQCECARLEKFHISVGPNRAFRRQELDPKIGFAISRDVKELIVEVHMSERRVRLPGFLFGYSLLVKLQAKNCALNPNEKVNWKHLKELSAFKCTFPDTAFDKILSACLSLESLDIKYCSLNSNVIASKSLRKLAVESVVASEIGISCPNLEELHLVCLAFLLFNNKTAASCDTVQLSEHKCVINSGSLKKLVFEDRDVSVLEMSCPVLEELELLSGLDIKTADLRSLISATLNFDIMSHVKGVLVQLRHVKEVNFGENFIKALPISEEIAHVFGGLSSNLKIVQIDSLSETDNNFKGVLNFIKILLDNARALEKIMVKVKDGSKSFVSEVSRRISTIHCLRNISR